MSVDEPTLESVETDVSQENAPAATVDIKQALRKSTSDVPLADLAKKGFKNVKVLNREVIARLIQEAVDRVIFSREREVTSEERRRYIEESKSQFEQLARQRSQVENQLLAQIEEQKQRLVLLENAETEFRKRQEEFDALRVENRRQSETIKYQEKEVEKLKRELADREPGSGQKNMMESLMAALLNKMQEQPQQAQGGLELSQIQAGIEGLAQKIANLRLAGGASGSDIVDKEVILERLFSRDEGTSMESNVSNVKVKEAKAGGLKHTLNKLKALQQGGTKDGD
jgi:chromosome segregation ATPase